MRKMRCYIALTILLLLFFHISLSEAATQMSLRISSKGTIYFTPSPSPSPPFPVGDNLAPIPDGFDGQIAYYDYIVLDESVKHNGNPSIRLDADYSGRDTRECNGYWWNVNPGDRIYFGVWCKTAVFKDDYPWTGGFMGIDLRGGGKVVATGSANPVVDGLPHNYEHVGGVWRSGDGDPQMDSFGNPLVSQFHVPYNNDWTWIYLDMIVPDTWYTIDAWDQETTGGYITGIIPWFGARHVTSEGSVWFADSVLYINP